MTSNYPLEIQKLQHIHQLKLQEAYNEYLMKLSIINSEYVFDLQRLTNIVAQNVEKKTSSENVEKKSQSVEKTSSENVEQPYFQPSTYQYENNPGIKEKTPQMSEIVRKAMERSHVVQNTQEDEEKSCEKRNEVSRLNLALQGEDYVKAVEKMQLENKQIWIYQVNSSIHLNPPVEENPRNVIVNVIDSNFDFSTFTPSNKCIISSVVGVGILGGL